MPSLIGQQELETYLPQGPAALPIVIDGEVDVEETSHSPLQVIREGRLSEIFFSVTFLSQPAMHNLARHWKVQKAAVEHRHNVFSRPSISTEVPYAVVNA
jgi:hypothetical protein